MGLVVNRLIDSLSFESLLAQLGVEAKGVPAEMAVHFGGPVESSRGFVLHTSDYHQDSTLVIDDEIALTATVDVLRAIASGTGPRRCVLALAMPAGRRDSSTPRFRRTAGCSCRPISIWCSASTTTPSGNARSPRSASI